MRQCRLFKEAISTRLTLLFTFIALIIFLIDGCLQAQAQTSTLEASIDDLETLTGCSETQVKAAAISDQTFPTDDKSKIFFLYNVKTGLLLNAGGYWGTHVSLQEYGMPLWIHLDSDQWIHLAQKFDKSDAGQEEGNYLEYETTGNKDEDKGVYVDRGYLYTYSNNSHSYGSHSSYGSYTTSTIVKRGWKMEAVSGKTNTYKLYTYLNNSSSPTTSASFGTTKYYLIAAKEQGDVDKNCGAVVEGSSDIAEGSDEWRFISYQQIFELQDKKTENIVNSLDLTFRLQCPSIVKMAHSAIGRLTSMAARDRFASDWNIIINRQTATETSVPPTPMTSPTKPSAVTPSLMVRLPSPLQSMVTTSVIAANIIAPMSRIPMEPSIKT